MSNYNIDWQSNGVEGIPGKTQIVLPQKTTDSTSTSLTLTGKGLPNYGEIQQENFIRLLENFASENPPSHPTIGQLWYNAGQNILYMRIDPGMFGFMQPLYFPQSPAAWAQIWPRSEQFASLTEYMSMALTLNKIIGQPSSDSPAAADQWGWGQTDLVPEYDNLNTLSSGFSPLVFPATFDNEAWVILLARLRKALRHVGGDESTVSPVGFINDGRPVPPAGSALSNTYNDNPAATTLADYTHGWGNAGQVTLQLYYANTISALAYLQSHRFEKAIASTQVDALASFTRTTPWNSTLIHTFDVTFASKNAADAYFNSGGALRFEWLHIPSVIDFINTSWQSFLAAESGLALYYNNTRRGTTVVYADADTSENTPGEGQSFGYYSLTTAPTTIYRRRREFSTYYAYISDGGIEVKAYTSTSGSGHTIHFQVYFHEGAGVGEVIQGSTLSKLWGHKANGVNVNSPVIAQPTVTQGGTFTL
jgi:hypothetical protein